MVVFLLRLSRGRVPELRRVPGAPGRRGSERVWRDE